MRPVSSVSMTVSSSASSCSKFHKATRDPVPPSQKKKKRNLLTSCPLKWMTSWFPGNEIITGILRTVLILIKSHFLKKRWPQTSHSSHPRSNSSFPIAPSWSPELAKFRPRIGDVYQISPLIWCAGPWLKRYPTQTTQMLKVQTYRNVQIDTDVLRSLCRVSDAGGGCGGNR